MADQTIGTVYVQVEPSGRSFGKAIEGDITPNIDNIGNKGSSSLLSKIGGAFGKIGKLGVGVIGTITTGIVGLAAKGGFSRALQIEQAQAKLKGLGHDASSVNEIMTDAQAAVKGTAFGLGDAATVAAALSASGIKQGGQLTNVLKTVADTAQISGRSMTDIGTIFGSVAARGKLQGDDMLQLMSSGVPVLQLLGKHLGKTSAEVSDMVSKGKIDFQTFADAMQEGLGGAALAAGGTFTGALENVKAALSRVGASFETPMLNGLRDMFNALIPVIDNLAAQLKPLSEQFANGLSPIVQQATAFLDKFAVQVASGTVTVQGLAGQLAELIGGFGLLAGVGGNLKTLTGLFDSLGKSGDKSIGRLLQATETLPTQLQTQFGKLSTLGSYFNSGIRDALTLDGDPFAASINQILAGTDKLLGPFKLLGNKIGSTKIAGHIASLGSDIAIGFGKLTSHADSSILAFGTRFGDKLSNVFASLGDTKLVSGLGAIGGKIQGALAPIASGIGDVFGGIGDMAAGPLQAGLNKLGGLVQSFFTPGNFMKFFGTAALAAALVAGVGLIDQSMNGELAKTVASISQQAPAAISGFVSSTLAALPQVMQSGVSIITSLLNGITQSLPLVISGAATIITGMVNGLAGGLPQMIPAAATMVMTLVTGLVQALPDIMMAGVNLLNGIIQGIVSAIPNLIAQLPVLISALVTGLVALLPNLMTGGEQILMGLINGIVTAIPLLAAQIPAIIGSIVNTIVGNLPQIVQTGIQLLLSLIDGIVRAIPQLVAALPQLIANIVSTLASNLPQIIAAGIQIIVALAGGLIQAIPRIIAALPAIINGIRNGFAQVNWGEVGHNIIAGIKNGIVSAASGLLDAALNAAKSALDGMKKLLGIHSPSRVFRDQVGVMISRGVAVGVTQGQPVVDSALRRVAGSLSLEDETFGLPKIGVAGYGLDQVTPTTGGRGLPDDALLRELQAIHEDLPLIMQQLGIQVDGREFGRVVDRYANA